MSKNKIIEKDLNKFRAEQRRKAYADTFKRAALDRGLVAMADWGLEDYKAQLKKLEK